MVMFDVSIEELKILSVISIKKKEHHRSKQTNRASKLTQQKIFERLIHKFEAKESFNIESGL